MDDEGNGPDPADGALGRIDPTVVHDGRRPSVLPYVAAVLLLVPAIALGLVGGACTVWGWSDGSGTGLLLGLPGLAGAAALLFAVVVVLRRR